MKEIRCPNCGTSFQISEYSNHPVTDIKDGVHYLVPETIRNNNVTKLNTRLEALKSAGVNVDKLQELMNGSAASEDIFKDLFDENDPILTELKQGGFLHNPELFRRWITAQTFRLIEKGKSWTAAVRRRYDTRYVYRQSKNELALLCRLEKKCPNDIRFQFFTLDDLKKIFIELDRYNFVHNTNEIKENVKTRILSCRTYRSLLDTVDGFQWAFHYRDCKFLPKTWLNCFKGAGAYYTLQNVIRTHELVLPGCENMNESLREVDNVFKAIVKYPYNQRRWDIMLSLLTNAVAKTHFELKW